eukprot:GHUV01027745.1.p1 GENE.GHUV01027745.1~~GHUV01027745.1.p1  ORF type:complete len:101 (-),score=7.24 GHUV01027745.1:640-942(-)
MTEWEQVHMFLIVSRLSTPLPSLSAHNLSGTAAEDKGLANMPVHLLYVWHPRPTQLPSIQHIVKCMLQIPRDPQNHCTHLMSAMPPAAADMQSFSCLFNE